MFVEEEERQMSERSKEKAGEEERGKLRRVPWVGIQRVGSLQENEKMKKCQNIKPEHSEVLYRQCELLN